MVHINLCNIILKHSGFYFPLFLKKQKTKKPAYIHKTHMDNQASADFFQQNIFSTL